MSLRVHAQMASSPSGTALLLFTCPYESFVSSKLFVANTGSSTTFSIYVLPADVDETPGSAASALYDGSAIAANDTVVVPPGITLERGDQIYVKSGSGTVTFTLFGEGQGKEG